MKNPSRLYSVCHGATTIREYWNGIKEVNIAPKPDKRPRFAQAAIDSLHGNFFPLVL